MILPVLDGSGRAHPPLSKNATTWPKKSFNFEHEVMEIGLICSNLIEKSHHSSNSGQKSAHIRHWFTLQHPKKNTTRGTPQTHQRYHWDFYQSVQSLLPLNKICIFTNF
jgi:hypothetical protein